MTAVSSALRFLLELLQHPVSQRILRHAIRIGTTELVREINRRTRVPGGHTMHTH